MRTECYHQSVVATGHAPVAVDSAQAWSIIHPVFHAFRDPAADDGLRMGDASMSDGVSLILPACFAGILMSFIQKAFWKALDDALPTNTVPCKQATWQFDTDPTFDRTSQSL
jgi:hypothetical protein